jgi:hypothetical protein
MQAGRTDASRTEQARPESVRSSRAPARGEYWIDVSGACTLAAAGWLPRIWTPASERRCDRPIASIRRQFYVHRNGGNNPFLLQVRQVAIV